MDEAALDTEAHAFQMAIASRGPNSAVSPGGRRATGEKPGRATEETKERP